LPSSSFLAKKMIKKSDLLSSNVIIELWAWSWIFTNIIFSLLWEDIKNKEVFIIEKDIDFYNLLLKKFPEYSEYIYNIDFLDIKTTFSKKNIKNVDLIISWLPFKSLPKEVFSFLVDDFFPKFINEKSKFIHFSYFSNFSEILLEYFNEVDIKKCLLNIPSAYIFNCSNFIKWK
jgi:phospholipid N-methyltransferase